MWRVLCIIALASVRVHATTHYPLRSLHEQPSNLQQVNGLDDYRNMTPIHVKRSIVSNLTISVTGTSPRGNLTFIDSPQFTERKLGAAWSWACRTSEPVVECRWSWQPRPLKWTAEKDLSDIPPEDLSEQPHPSLWKPVRTFEAFGNDCSLPFDSTKHEQAGYWTCAARRRGDENFTSTAPVKLQIVQNNTVPLIRFEDQEYAVMIPEGTSDRLPCRTLSPVDVCRWSWRSFHEGEPWIFEKYKFSPSGENNDKNNCDLDLQATKENIGELWCSARVAPDSPFIEAAHYIMFDFSQLDG